MSVPDEPARVLLAATPSHLEALRILFETPELAAWTIIEADTAERLHFLERFHSCDAFVLDADLVSDADVLRLRSGVRKPVILLGEGHPPPCFDLRTASWTWLPIAAVLQHPSLLVATLGHLNDVVGVQEKCARAQAAWQSCRRQVDGLVDLLWQVVPGEMSVPWFSQRYMLQRCEEEVARSRRHATPLSVVLGDLHFPCGDEPSWLPRWVVQRICRSKRRSDVAGQYGPRGFMLLLPSTPATGAAACCQRLHQVLATMPAGEGPPAPVQLAFGIADQGSTAPTVPSLLRRAEEALERAKVCGVPLAS